MAKLEKKKNLNSSSSIDLESDTDDYFQIEDEPSITEQSISKDALPWDAFKYYRIEKKSASLQNKQWLDVSMHIIKVFVYIIVFCIVLCSSLVAKCTVLFAISQLEEENSIEYCDYLDINQKLRARISRTGIIIWTWTVIFMFLIPEGFNVLQSIWCSVFKKKEKMPKKRSIAVLFIFETLHSIGLAHLVFYSLPKLNSIDAAAISSCVCFIPVLLSLFSENRRDTSSLAICLLILLCNILALVAQISGLFSQNFLYYDPITWILPIALLLSSCRWWRNYVSDHSYFGFIRLLTTINTDLRNNCYFLQGFVAIWRSLIFIICGLVISIFKGIQIREFFECVGQNKYNVELIQNSNDSFLTNTLESNYYSENILQQRDLIINGDTSVPLNIFLIQIFCTFVTYLSAIFAFKTQMHKFSFAFPLSLTTPGTILLIIILCVMRQDDSCAFHKFIPDFLFFKEPSYSSMKDFVLSWRIWCWIIWWLSQIWITKHLWFDEKEKLAFKEKIFYSSTYDSLMIDQFIGLNKRKHRTNSVDVEDSVKEHEIDSLREMQSFYSLYSNDTIINKRSICATQIYACATMWHETKEEMNELIGSILRLDQDQCAMKVTQKYYKISIKDYYELETHILFDDAFRCKYGCSEICDHNENETQINQYVATFMETIQEKIQTCGICLSPPIKCPTPYGGQLVWTLPGKSRLIVHLKDKNKIRHRKRWSQVMYMYYLLGYRLMSSSMNIEHKELTAENTYILTLDGDIDFHPKAVKALIDLMKKDKELSAVCGRIHPVGSGPMVWFQKFEYALGHWLQKSTEHVIGSVLCSPGCFSLFRAKALMQHNIIAKYATTPTEPRHYIQYDQGEDRWLCTLLLQIGCKIQYCAAGDAYTHAPESFKDFYIQRRRWIPSTVANIFDLLSTSKETRKVNNNISLPYIMYQWILLGSTVIGPSFIYLMMASAFVISFQIGQWPSFWYHLIPIIIFLIICFLCEEQIQLIAAEIITVIYALVMIIVLVGILIEIATEGSFAPNTLLFYITVGQFLLTGLMHPQEFSCLSTAIVYYATVPSMYMLLIIFSIFNVHNVTWGTRETKEQIKISEKQFTKTNKSQHDEKSKWANFSWAKLFKCDFCTKKNSEEETYLNSIYNSLNEINIRLERMERSSSISKDIVEEKNDKDNKTYSKQTELQITKNDLREDTDSESEISEETSSTFYKGFSNYLINPNWLKDEHMQNGKVDFLSTSEEEFWKQLIEKYLHPIEKDLVKQRSIAKGLINIRNECLLKFFTLNIIFVVAIFLLQLNKDILHIQWPFAILYNITCIQDMDEVHVSKQYLHLEPVGCLFIVAYVLILCMQFLAMLIHRFDTFTHIIANVKLKLPFRDKVDYSSNNLITNKHANQIVQGLQSAIENDTTNILKSNIMGYSEKQKTIRELVEETRNVPRMPTNLEALFHKKLKEPHTSGFSKIMSSHVSKDVIEAFETRRTEIIEERKKCQQNDNEKNETSNFSSKESNTKATTNHEYDNPTFLEDNNE